MGLEVKSSTRVGHQDTKAWSGYATRFHAATAWAQSPTPEEAIPEVGRQLNQPVPAGLVSAGRLGTVAWNLQQAESPV